MKGKNIVPYTRYSKDQINSHRDLIIEIGGERKATYLFEQLDEVIILKDKFEIRSNDFITANSNKKFLRDKKKKVLEDSHSLYNLTYKIISAGGKEATKSYFKSATPSSIKKNIDLLLKSLKETLVVIKNPGYDKLDLYEDKYIKNIENLKEYLSEKAEFNSKKDEINTDVTLLIFQWDIEYANLKSFARVVFNGSEYDYRILFKDLGNPTPKPSDKNSSTTSDEEKKEETDSIEEKKED